MADNPYKWIGIDPIGMMFGGQDSKLKSLNSALSSLSDAIKKINTLNTLIQTGLDVATAAVLTEINANIEKLGITAILETIKNSINDIKGTNCYFLDMNTSGTPLYMYGQSPKEFYYRTLINSIKAKVAYEQSRLIPDPVEVTTLTNQIKVNEALITNIGKSKKGGTYAYYKTYADSLNDQYDFNRPQFTKDAPIFAMFTMFGATNLSDFFSKLDSLYSVIKNSSLPDRQPRPLLNLKAKLVHPAQTDAEYMFKKDLVDKGVAAFMEGDEETSPDSGYATHRVYTTSGIATNLSKEYSSNTVPNIIVVITSKEQRDNQYIFGLQTKSPIWNKINSATDKVVLDFGIVKGPEFLDKNSVTYILDMSQVWQLTGKEDTDKDIVYKFKNIDGNLVYNPKVTYKKDFESINLESGLLVYDPESESGIDGNVFLSWDYPISSGIMTRFFARTSITETSIYVYKHKIVETDRFKDLTAAYISKEPPKIEKDKLTVEPYRSFFGLRKFCVADIGDAEEQLSQGVLKYEFMAACGYKMYQKVSVPVVGGTLRTEYYPMHISEIDPKDLETSGLTEEAAKVKERVTSFFAERKEILDWLRKSKAVESKTTLQYLIDKYGDDNVVVDFNNFYKGTNQPGIIRRLGFSNVATVDMVSAYDVSSSIAPDWKSFRHLTQLYPALFAFIDNLVAYVDSLIEAAKDPLSFIPEKLMQLKKESGLVAGKILSILSGLSGLLESLKTLAAGIYILPVSASKGGVEFTRKALALSLQGTYANVDWNMSNNPNLKALLTEGPPPFGPGDYIGGYVILTGTANVATLLGDLYNYIKNKIISADDATVNWLNNQPNLVTPANFGKDTGIPDDIFPLTEEELVASQQRAIISQIIAIFEVAPVAQVSGLLSQLVPECVFENQNLAMSLKDSTDDDIKASALSNNDKNKLLELIRLREAGSLLDSVKNYDGTSILDPGFIAFKEALKSLFDGVPEGTTGTTGPNANKLIFATQVLINTGFIFPSDLTKYISRDAMSAWIAFKLKFGEALNQFLTALGAGPIAQTTIDPYALIDFTVITLEEDNYQTGWNVAVWSNFDPRTMSASVYNTAFETLGRWDILESKEHFDTWESVALIEWEIALVDSIVIL